MLSRREDFAPHRLALLGAVLAIAGILLSGPLAAAVIHAVRSQPQWFGVSLFLVTLVLAAAALHRRARAGVP